MKRIDHRLRQPEGNWSIGVPGDRQLDVEADIQNGC